MARPPGPPEVALRATPVALAIAGSASVATAFGMARYGYGLLLPDIKRDLVLGEAELGAIGTLGYATYVVAALVVGAVIGRWGARPAVAAGGALAVAGTTVVALAHDAGALAAGVATAGASAGLVYPPFAEALRGLAPETRGRAMAAVNCGTGWGVAVAAPLAILAGGAWRLAYLGFAGCACLSTLYAWRTLGPQPARGRSGQSPRRAGGDSRRGVRLRDRFPIRPGLLRLLGGAVLVGLGSATYWTFAVQHVRDAGLDTGAGRIVLGVAGVGSLAGIGAADLVSRLGAPRTFIDCALLEAAAIAAVGVLPWSLPAALISAFAFGLAYNILVAVSVLTSTAMYGERPSTGVGLVAGANAAGLLCGPLLGGTVADAVGLTTTLLGGAGLLAAASLVAPTVPSPVEHPSRRLIAPETAG